jgi:hypothetical protein
MAFSVNHLEPQDQAIYNAVADLLGPIGKPSLDLLCEAVYQAGYDEAY